MKCIQHPQSYNTACTRKLPNSVHNWRFQVEFVADTLRLNLLELGKSGSHLISVAGRLDYKCPTGETHDPITFTTRESHLVSSPHWDHRRHTYMLAHIFVRRSLRKYDIFPCGGGADGMRGTHGHTRIYNQQHIADRCKYAQYISVTDGNVQLHLCHT